MFHTGSRTIDGADADIAARRDGTLKKPAGEPAGFSGFKARLLLRELVAAGSHRFTVGALVAIRSGAIALERSSDLDQ